jgi:hypothetical protein
MLLKNGVLPGWLSETLDELHDGQAYHCNTFQDFLHLENYHGAKLCAALRLMFSLLGFMFMILLFLLQTRTQPHLRY